MPNFSVKFSFSKDDELIHHKTAIVRASSLDEAKRKIYKYYRSNDGSYSSFDILKISVSSYNLVLV